MSWSNFFLVKFHFWDFLSIFVCCRDFFLIFLRFFYNQAGIFLLFLVFSSFDLELQTSSSILNFMVDHANFFFRKKYGLQIISSLKSERWSRSIRLSYFSIFWIFWDGFVLICVSMFSDHLHAFNFYLFIFKSIDAWKNAPLYRLRDPFYQGLLRGFNSLFPSLIQSFAFPLMERFNVFGIVWNWSSFEFLLI